MGVRGKGEEGMDSGFRRNDDVGRGGRGEMAERSTLRQAQGEREGLV